MNNIDTRFSDLKNKIQMEIGKRDLLKSDLLTTKKSLQQIEKDFVNVLHALTIIQEVAKQTQEELRYYISEIPSLALSAVFEDPYEFVVEFVRRRDKTEADLLFKRGDNEINPIEASGLGAVDVAGFGLRLALWNLKKPATRNTFVFDEVFKHLKGENQNINIIQIIKEMSKKLGIQIIMVHDERVGLSEIEKGADKIFKVRMKKRVSEVGI